MAIPYTKTWTKSTTAYQVFQKCANGLRKVHPDFSGFNIDLDNLYYTPAEDVNAQFAFESVKKVGLFALANGCNTYEDLLAVMIHEFAHCLNCLESALITTKKGGKKCGHGKAFRDACRRLAKVICTEEEYKMCLLTAFDGPVHISLDYPLYYCGSNMIITEAKINTNVRGFKEICTVREILRYGANSNLLRDFIETMNIQQNLCMDPITKDAEEFYSYSENIKELSFSRIIRWGGLQKWLKKWLLKTITKQCIIMVMN